jgi:hypothetical protein
MTKSKRRKKHNQPSRIPVPGQRFGSIWQACAYAGIGRSKLYELARQNPDLMRKCDGKSIIDFPVLDRIFDALPRAYGA